MEKNDQDTTTPLMKQYWELKSQCENSLLFFRMGDFYELFAEDAITASQILGITLTSRDKNKPDPTPMAGVPHHSAQGYIQKLLNAQKKVAIAEQVEDPSQAKGIVKREITRIFSPAVQFDQEGAESNFLFTLLPSEKNTFIFASLEPSTGETRVEDFTSLEAFLQSEGLQNLKHFVYIENLLPPAIHTKLESLNRFLCEKLPTNTLSQKLTEATLKNHYKIDSILTFFKNPTQAYALAILIQYVSKTQKLETLSYLKLPRPLYEPGTLSFGTRTTEHLDLFPTPAGTPCLFDFINQTRCSMGSRELRQRLNQPLTDLKTIQQKQETLIIFHQNDKISHSISTEVSKIYDLERILGRIHTGLASPTDTLALGKSIEASKNISKLLSHSAFLKTPYIQSIKSDLDDVTMGLDSLSNQIIKTQKDPAPLLSREGGIFNLGTNTELDKLITLNENGEKWLVDLEQEERKKTGITSLKVKYNRVFGYFIEITNVHLKNVPSHYQRKQTTTNGERFFTDELKKFEEDILSASSKQKNLEQELFKSLIDTIRSHTHLIMKCAQKLGELDCLIALSLLLKKPGWAMPKIDDSLSCDIKRGRHPLVDEFLKSKFVPNDVQFTPGSQMALLITGPNMGGKSTFMRQVALMIILGQMGAPIPAQSAQWGVFSSIHTRIGAQDAIALGQSTFMVEMSELAHIIHKSDERSLIILDEIGRGTSTFDGISVAWSTLEWILTQIKARTLFATHYHELTELSEHFPQLKNAHLAVEGNKKELRFLYSLKEGPSNESFGIQVAKLAGIPTPIIQRAWKVLEKLEKKNPHAHQDPSQLSLFEQSQSALETDFPEAEEPTIYKPFPTELMEELSQTAVNTMTPLEALNTLAKLQEKARTLDEGSF